MSKTKVVSVFTASLILLAASSWFVTGTIPLYGAPQMVFDGPGVAVETNGARLMHRGAVTYPAEAMMKFIEGTVTAQVKLDSSGNVVDANIVSGPDELRRAVLQSVLNWHFGSDAANGTRQVAITFRIPQQNPLPAAEVVRHEDSNPAEATSSGEIHRLKSIVVSGLATPEKDALMARLPVREGDAFTRDTLSTVTAAVRVFDHHLVVGTTISPTDYTLRISTPEALTTMYPPPAPYSYKGPGIRVDPVEQQSKLLTKQNPVYPPLAKAARVQGTVRFEAVISKEGSMQNLHLLAGPPLLVQAAMQAVQQWTYRPTLLNNNPTEVVTTIDVNFTLAQ